jgi:hypothetical protein
MPGARAGDKVGPRLSRSRSVTSFRGAHAEGNVSTALRTSVVLAALAMMAAPAHTQDPGETGHAPLAVWTGRKVIVLPVCYLQEGDSLGWGAQIPDVTQWLASFDAELTFALADRGLKTVWVMSDRLLAEYRRNQDYMSDPYHLAAEWLRYPGPKKVVPYLPDPLAGQLRSILAMNDKAEYVLLPIEIRFVAVPGLKGGQAVLRVAVIDPRRLKTPWMADVSSDIEEKFTPALLTSLAEHLANLFVAPR